MHTPRSPGTLAALFTLAIATTALLPAQGGRQLWETYGQGFSRSGGYGTSIAVVGDVNGDLFDDIAVGDPTQLGGASSSGVVQILSGIDGSLLQTLAPVTGDFQLGLLVAPAGDVNADRTPDVLAASPDNVTVYSGIDGSVLAQFAVRAVALAGPGDWNNDQIPDLAWIVQQTFGVPQGPVQVVSGLDGSLLQSVRANATALAVIPSAVPGIRHLAVLEQGNLTLYSSMVSTLWTRSGYQTVERAGANLVAVAAGGATTDLLSGVDGSVQQTLPGGDNASGGVDISGDGIPDVVIGDPSEDFTRGTARAYSGADGSLLFERTGQETGEAMGWDVAIHPGAGSTTRPAAIVAARAKYNGSVDAGAVLALAQAAPGEFDGSFRPFGQPCNFTFTTIRPGPGLPTIGQTYGFRFDNNTRPVGFEFLVLGASRTTWAGIPLPVTLPSTLSCTLYVSIDIAVPVGFASFQSLAIPRSAGLVGLEVYVQGLSLSGFPVVETSDAATIGIGN